MKLWDRIVDGVTRLANGETLGSLLGLTAPSAADGGEHPGLRQMAFTIGVIALGAKMAGADGEVTESEIAAFRRFFSVPPGEERNVERFFNLAKRDVAGFDIGAVTQVEHTDVEPGPGREVPVRIQVEHAIAWLAVVGRIGDAAPAVDEPTRQLRTP